MQTIPIEALPNQRLSVTIGANRWTLRIKVAVTSMIADVLLNDQPIILGQRIAAGTPIIPYPYLAIEGNFLLLIDSEELPDWRAFGRTQQLVYVTPEELA